MALLEENFLPSLIFCPCYGKYSSISDNASVSFVFQQTTFQEKNLVEKSGRSNTVCARYSSVNSYPNKPRWGV